MRKQRKSPYVRHHKQPCVYTFDRCSHNHTHLETTDGVRYAVCDACGTIRDNELTARLQEREFQQPLQEFAQAA
jgi:transcription elongation factor Elf1